MGTEGHRVEATGPGIRAEDLVADLGHKLAIAERQESIHRIAYERDSTLLHIANGRVAELEQTVATLQAALAEQHPEPDPSLPASDTDTPHPEEG